MNIMMNNALLINSCIPLQKVRKSTLQAQVYTSCSSIVNIKLAVISSCNKRCPRAGASNECQSRNCRFHGPSCRAATSAPLQVEQYLLHSPDDGPYQRRTCRGETPNLTLPRCPHPPATEEQETTISLTDPLLVVVERTTPLSRTLKSSVNALYSHPKSLLLPP